jgi:hypothetical protein
MDDKLLYVFSYWQLCIVYFVGIVFFAILGFRLGKRSRHTNDSDGGGFEAAKTGIITVLGLLMAFTFGAAGTRYLLLKKIITDEANSIGTACLRANLYDEPDRSEFRKYFSEYLEARISFHEAGTNLTKIDESKKISERAAINLWNKATQMSKVLTIPTPSMLMIPALNTMFDAATTRETSLKSKVPAEILLMIFLITFVAVFITGYTSKYFGRKELLVLVSFAIVTTSVFFIILDLDRPDVGVIRTTIEQDAMIELRKNFVNEK